MRVLHLVHQFLPDHVGGTELYTQSLARAQARRGSRVAVFAPEPRVSDAVLEESVAHGVMIFRSPAGARSGIATFRSSFGNSKLEDALAQVLERFQPEIIHIQHLMGLPINVVDLLAAQGIPYVIALHDYWYRCANAQLLTNYDQTICPGPNHRATNCAHCALARAGIPGAGLLSPVMAPIMRRRNSLLHDAFSAADKIFAPNDFVRNTYAALGLPVDRVTVLPWGMDLPEDLPEIRRAAEIARQGRPLGPLRLGYIGGLSYQKGLHVLIAAVNKLPEASVTLDIYGNPAVFPEYVSDIRQQATHPGIHFRGLLAREGFWPRLAELDALVLPTLWYEASPLTIDEAFAAGTPVVGSDIGALPAMIRDGVDGRLFTVGDAGALADCLLELQRDPGYLARLREGIRPVKTMDTHALEIEFTYDYVLAGRPAQK